MENGRTPISAAPGRSLGAAQDKLEWAGGPSGSGTSQAATNQGNRSVRAWREAQSQLQAALAAPTDPPAAVKPPPLPDPEAPIDAMRGVFEQVERKAHDATVDKLFTQLRTAPDGEADNHTGAPRLPAAIYVVSLFINLLALALPVVVLLVYDRILPNRASEILSVLMIALVGVLILDAAMKVARAYMVGWIAARHEYGLSGEAVSRILHASSSEIETEPATVHIDRLNALDAMRKFHGGEYRLLLLDMPFVFLFLALVGYIGGYLMLVPIALFLLLGSVSIAAGTALREIFQIRAEHDDRRYDFIVESLSGIQTIKAMAMEPQIQRRFERLQTLGFAASQQTISLGNSAQIASNLFSSLAMISVVAVGGYMVSQGALTIGALAACTLLTGRTLQPILRILDLWLQMQTVSVARARVARLFALKPAGVAAAAVDKLSGAIAVRQVSFAYGPDKPLVLKNVNLDVAPGGMIALRGGDGSGKSTLIRLIRGEFAPTTGEIRLDSCDPAGLQGASIARLIAYVPQNASIFQGTILENITMFRSGEAIDAARESARLIGLESDIHHLPSGYDTMLGEGIADELPVDLLQRIAIVRALSRKPKILLFDEANVALDARSDELLRWGLEQLKGHTTVVIVSQRPSLLQTADQVYALQGGQLFDVTAEYSIPAPQREMFALEAS